MGRGWKSEGNKTPLFPYEKYNIHVVAIPHLVDSFSMCNRYFRKWWLLYFFQLSDIDPCDIIPFPQYFEGYIALQLNYICREFCEFVILFKNHFIDKTIQFVMDNEVNSSFYGCLSAVFLVFEFSCRVGRGRWLRNIIGGQLPISGALRRKGSAGKGKVYATLFVGEVHLYVGWRIRSSRWPGPTDFPFGRAQWTILSLPFRHT